MKETKKQKQINKTSTNQKRTVGEGLASTKRISAKGITLIALVITIIVLLILASIAINLTLGDNGIFTKAQEARDEMERTSLIEKIQTEILEKQLANEETNINKGDLEDILKKHGEPQKDEEGNITGVKPDGKEEIIPIEDIIGDNKITEGVNVEDIFDETGTEEGKLHIGDFINYTAGTWEDSDMTTIAETGVAPNNSTNIPGIGYQFGGFTTGRSRDENAPNCDLSYGYVQDKETGSAVTGWRLFDVSNGVITLISAGCPEDYKLPSDEYSAFISEYILTGIVNSAIAEMDLGLGSTYKARNWGMYVNRDYGATEASMLTNDRLLAWYTKYTNTEETNIWSYTMFGKIYKASSNCVNNGMYESLIDNYSEYWLAKPRSHKQMNLVSPRAQSVSGSEGSWGWKAGVRILVTLSSEIKLSEKAVGTKIIKSRSNEYPYNVWSLITK